MICPPCKLQLCIYDLCTFQRTEGLSTGLERRVMRLHFKHRTLTLLIDLALCIHSCQPWMNANLHLSIFDRHLNFIQRTCLHDQNLSGMVKCMLYQPQVIVSSFKGSTFRDAFALCQGMRLPLDMFSLPFCKTSKEN